MPSQPDYLSAPVFSFTSDLDWAPEEAIAETLALFDEYDVPLTPFVTHDSGAIRLQFDSPGQRSRVGIHPNFFPQSTHGVNETDVLDTACALWPDAKGFRSHGFVDYSNLTFALRDRGFQWDSNLALFLQERLVPLEHISGLVRFPVFWEDSVHIHKRLALDLGEIVRLVATPGLKVINVHPIHVALNTFSPEHYAESRNLAVEDARFDGVGIRTLLTDLLSFVRERSLRTAYLHDLFLEHDAVRDDRRALRNRAWARPEHSQPQAVVSGGAMESYRAAQTDARAAMLRAEYDRRDGGAVYTTSRDFNLRELEGGFISEHLGEGRVLDIGCGNGYTLISLARRLQAEMVGVDFSASMIEGARALAELSPSELKGTLTFQQGDVRALPFQDGSFDFAISERCLLNLPSREDQWQTIREIHRVLVDGGVYLMVEGTEDGLRRLNDARQAVGLEPIPSVSDSNFSSLKFDEDELREFLGDLFTVAEVRYFGAYYLISRVLHPLLALPNSPSFAASINSKAREIEQVVRDCGKLGHVAGYKLVARKAPGAT